MSMQTGCIRLLSWFFWFLFWMMVTHFIIFLDSKDRLWMLQECKIQFKRILAAKTCRCTMCPPKAHMMTLSKIQILRTSFSSSSKLMCPSGFLSTIKCKFRFWFFHFLQDSWQSNIPLFNYTIISFLQFSQNLNSYTEIEKIWDAYKDLLVDDERRSIEQKVVSENQLRLQNKDIYTIN